MPIEPFKIVNPDGSTNQSEYERCINFLNEYISGSVKIYPETTWANPVEIDMSLEESALEILSRYILYTENKLLNKNAYKNIKKLFHGILDRYGSTIHTYGKYLEQSKNFVDGPGYSYDVILDKDTHVNKHDLNSDISIYYLDDENHTVLEYNDTAYTNKNIDNLPTTNYPYLNLPSSNTVIKSNVTGYPFIYSGNLCGVYSDFQRLSGQYVGSSTLFYYSMCNDQLFTTGPESYQDSRTKSIYNFNYRMNIADKSKPVRGIDPSLISTAQQNVLNIDKSNAYINPSVVNNTITYNSPLIFTANNEAEWII